MEAIYTCPDMTEYVQRIGMLPLLNLGIVGWSADEVVDEDCRYVVNPDGGWEWQLWKWKGSIIEESGCAYGKFFDRKAGFITQEWWGHFCNYRRSIFPRPEEGSIDEAVLLTLREHGSLITRQLRAMCGFTGKNMRSKFDAYVTRLEMGTYIVTENFIYPHDKHGKEYGWGWSLLTTPERLFGKDACTADCTPEESLEILKSHFRTILPHITEKQLLRLLSGSAR